MKVLIVDDEVSLVSTIVERLEIRNVEAVGVHSGDEALAKIAKTSFDIIILDVRLKGESGVEIMKKIKMINSEIPVILLTGHMSPETSEEGLKAGAIDCIIKPIDLDKLIVKMKEAIALYRKQ